MTMIQCHKCYHSEEMPDMVANSEEKITVGPEDVTN